MIRLGISLAIGLVMLFVFAGTTIVKLTLFTLDKFVIFIAISYFTHNYFSLKFSSGKAVYFWDIVIALIAVGLYTILFKLIYERFSILGKIMNFGISFLGAMTAYCMLVNIITGEYFLPLLNNNTVNQVVNYAIITILSGIVFVTREEKLNGSEDSGEYYFVRKNEE